MHYQLLMSQRPSNEDTMTSILLSKRSPSRNVAAVVFNQVAQAACHRGASESTTAQLADLPEGFGSDY